MADQPFDFQQRVDDVRKHVENAGRHKPFTPQWFQEMAWAYHHGGVAYGALYALQPCMSDAEYKRSRLLTYQTDTIIAAEYERMMRSPKMMLSTKK